MNDCATVSTTPYLDQLGLPGDHLLAVQQTGYVTCECRGQRKYYKLRYRIHGHQRVKYLGASFGAAEQIRGELRILQGHRDAMRTLRRLDRLARKTLKAEKLKLEPVLRRSGFRFHGFAIRKTRTGPLGCDQPVRSRRKVIPHGKRIKKQ